MLIWNETAFANRQPNSDYCFICGRKNPHGLYMTFYDDGHKTVLASHVVPEMYQGYPGVVHGGIVAAMLDEAVGRVAMIADHHHFMFSVRLEVKYRHPVPTETPLKIVGRIERLRGRLGKAVGEVYLPDGTLAAEAAMTLADVPEEMLANADLEALGWYVDV
jgi:acyl-coenzyme A thioesterase PaaI-like protein